MVRPLAAAPRRLTGGFSPPWISAHRCQAGVGGTPVRPAQRTAWSARHEISSIRHEIGVDSEPVPTHNPRLRTVPSKQCRCCLDMNGIARISFIGGARLMPARNGYDRELVFDEAEFCAR